MADRNLRALADAAAKKYGVPPSLFRRLIQQESGWNPDARNPSGATGLVQIHLPSHPDISEQQARDPGFALAWGARYLAAQKARFGRWDLALAAYNAGPGNVESGRWKSFPETTNYVKSIMRGGITHAPIKGGKAPVQPRTSGANAVSPIPQPDLLGQVFQSNNNLLGVDTPSFVADLLSKLAAPSAAPAPSSPGAPVPQGIPLPGTPLTGLRELFHDPKGAWDEGSFIPAIGGHGKHLHAAANNPQAMLAIIKEAQRRGLTVRENPYTDRVDPVHTTGSHHYQTFRGKYNGRQLGNAADISGGDLGSLYDWILNRFGISRSRG